MARARPCISQWFTPERNPQQGEWMKQSVRVLSSARQQAAPTVVLTDRYFHCLRWEGGREGGFGRSQGLLFIPTVRKQTLWRKDQP